MRLLISSVILDLLELALLIFHFEWNFKRRQEVWHWFWNITPFKWKWHWSSKGKPLIPITQGSLPVYLWSSNQQRCHDFRYKICWVITSKIKKVYPKVSRDQKPPWGSPNKFTWKMHENFSGVWKKVVWNESYGDERGPSKHRGTGWLDQKAAGDLIKIAHSNQRRNIKYSAIIEGADEVPREHSVTNSRVWQESFKVCQTFGQMFEGKRWVVSRPWRMQRDHEILWAQRRELRGFGSNKEPLKISWNSSIYAWAFWKVVSICQRRHKFFRTRGRCCLSANQRPPKRIHIRLKVRLQFSSEADLGSPRSNPKECWPLRL